MTTRKFVIEVEEGVSKCSDCPLDRMDGVCHYPLEIMFNTTCNQINLATIKIKEYDDR